jgi:hypothetical protein
VLYASLGGVVTTFSLASGFVVWPISLVLLLTKKTLRSTVMLWTLAGVVCSGLYYWHYVNPAYHPSKTLFLHEPLAFLQYVLVYIGRPLSISVHEAGVVGAAMILMFVVSVVYLWRAHRAMLMKLLFWVGIALFGLSGALLTAVSRLGFGVNQSFSGRYVTTSLLFTIGTLVLASAALLELLRHYKWRTRNVQRIYYGLATVLMLIVAVNWLVGVHYMREQHDHLARARACLETVQVETDPCLLLSYPNSHVAWERLQFLRATHQGGL